MRSTKTSDKNQAANHRELWLNLELHQVGVPRLTRLPDRLKVELQPNRATTTTAGKAIPAFYGMDYF
jgi:hypothetical protein